MSGPTVLPHLICVGYINRLLSEFIKKKKEKKVDIMAGHGDTRHLLAHADCTVLRLLCRRDNASLSLNAGVTSPMD